MAKREYENSYPSVTQILNVLRKIALENWFKNNTAEFCNRESAKGKKVGTHIHEAIQSYIETGIAKVDTEFPDEVTNALKSFMLFRKEKPEYLLRRAELPLTSEKYKFNGTIDCIGEGILIDWKSGNAKDEEKPKIYDEHRYQTSAYVHLYNEVNNANIDSALIVMVAKDKIAYDLAYMNKEEIDGHFYNAFLPALTIHNHQRRVKCEKTT